MNGPRRWRAVLLAALLIAGTDACAKRRAPATSVDRTGPAGGAAAADGDAGTTSRAVPVPAGGLALDLVALKVLPEGDPLPGDLGFAVGGLSGCSVDPSTGRILVVSDDRDQPRVFELDVRPERERLLVEVAAVRRIDDGSAGPVRLRALDMEGIVALAAGDVLISSEGALSEEPPVLPAITHHAPDGRVVDRLVVPSQFLPGAAGHPAQGVLANRALESLTRAPDDRLFTASEGPLVQDGDRPGFDEQAVVRLLEYVPGGASWRPARQFAYAMSPVARPDGFGPSTLATGVAELLALDAERLLVLERSYVAERADARRGTNVVRIYQVSVRDAEDVSSLAALRGRNVRPLDKRLVLDLDTLKPRLARELPTLENFEAMCHGPRLADGSATLLLISDNNFNRRQKTAFLLFRIERPL